MTDEPSTDSPKSKRLVVLLSGTGSLAEQLLIASSVDSFPGSVVAIGSDRPDAPGLRHAQMYDVDQFVTSPTDFGDRGQWDEALAAQLVKYQPDWIVSAGFMRILGPRVLEKFPNRIVNSHPALLPAFPGAHAVRDALAYGVKVTGCTVHFVDGGVDTGPVLAQLPVSVEREDTEESLHERIKQVERQLLTRVVENLCRRTVHIENRRVILT